MPGPSHGTQYRTRWVHALKKPCDLVFLYNIYVCV
jgi:hypothetical protein